MNRVGTPYRLSRHGGLSMVGMEEDEIAVRAKLPSMNRNDFEVMIGDDFLTTR